MLFQTKKISRELTRLKDQISSWFMNLYEPYFRWQHDKNFAKIIDFRINNQHRLSEKVAVFLIFQPTGLAQSVFLTLKHLHSNGYSTILLSNCKMLQEDISEALPFCWKIMVRPNFGYDFGGYKDGIKTAVDTHPSLNQLLILNDSIWFPLHSGCQLLKRMEDHPNGFIGAFQLTPVRDLRKMRGKKRPFMGSFFWHFKKPVLNGPAFKKFWQNYKPTSSKYATIRRGERRFTHFMLDSGVPGEYMYSREQFDNWLNQTSGKELAKLLVDLCTTNPSLAVQQQSLFTRYRSDQRWDEEAKFLARAITETQNIMATAPLFMVEQMGLPFIKKSADTANLLALSKLINYWDSNPMAISSCVLNEMKATVKKASHKPC